MRMGPGRSSQQQLQQQQQQMMATEGDSQSLVDQLEFEARLKALKAVADEKKTEVRSKTSPSVLDGPQYENPPPLSQTLFGGGEKASDQDYAEGSFGPSQIGLAIAAVALVGVFLLTNSGSDLGYSTRRPSPGAGQELGPEQRKEVETALAEMTGRLATSPDDLEALESAAVMRVRLGDYAAAAKQLEQLTAAKPGDAEAWRVLGEVRGALGETSSAVTALRRAWEVSEKSSLQALTALMAGLAADGKGQAAVDEVRSLMGSAAAQEQIGTVELELLLAKAYSAWPGHAGDALAQYTALAEAHPDDFRIPLGKALLLRSQGQEGDATRYLIQARYLAPPASRGAVDALANAAAP